MSRSEHTKRWIALIVLCMGALMIVLDTTVVNVALPSIRADLGFSETSLAWVVNAYALTFAGFLLLGGRLGDLFGQRRFFIAGIALFSLASLLCGIASSQTMLIMARAVQGIGGAIASAISLSLMMALFREPQERAKAMGVFGFVAAGGGSIGVFLGGVLTGALNWHWIFLVNVPIGLLVGIFSLILLPQHAPINDRPRIDLLGAASVTLGLLVAVYAIIGGNAAGWLSAQTLGLLATAALLLGAFIFIERHVAHPLVPLRLFALRNVAIANIVGILWSAGMFAWFFLSALYMQLVLGYDPLRVGLAFLPANIIMGAFSLGLSARIVMRFGLRMPIGVGMSFIMLGLAYLARTPIDGHFLLDILPSMVLLGLGAGIALNPVLLAAMSDVPEDESGLASGIANTAFMMGGSLGLAVLASVAAARSAAFLSGGFDHTISLAAGYGDAFIVGAGFAFVAALLAFFLRDDSISPARETIIHTL